MATGMHPVDELALNNYWQRRVDEQAARPVKDGLRKAREERARKYALTFPDDGSPAPSPVEERAPVPAPVPAPAPEQRTLDAAKVREDVLGKMANVPADAADPEPNDPAAEDELRALIGASEFQGATPAQRRMGIESMKAGDPQPSGEPILGSAVTELGDAVGWGAATAADEGLNTLRDAYNWFNSFRDLVPAEREEIRLARNLAREPDSTLGRGMASIVQFTLPYLVGIGPATKAVKAIKLARSKVGSSIAGDMVAGAAADAFFFDPNEERLATMLNEVPALKNVIPDWIASADPDDPRWEGRLKNALEGAALGGAVGGLYMAMRSYIRSHHAGRASTGLDGAEREAYKANAARAASEGMEAAQAAGGRPVPPKDQPPATRTDEPAEAVTQPSGERIEPTIGPKWGEAQDAIADRGAVIFELDQRSPGIDLTIQNQLIRGGYTDRAARELAGLVDGPPAFSTKRSDYIYARSRSLLADDVRATLRGEETPLSAELGGENIGSREWAQAVLKSDGARNLLTTLEPEEIADLVAKASRSPGEGDWLRAPFASEYEGRGDGYTVFNHLAEIARNPEAFFKVRQEAADRILWEAGSFMDEMKVPEMAVRQFIRHGERPLSGEPRLVVIDPRPEKVQQELREQIGELVPRGPVRYEEPGLAPVPQVGPEEVTDGSRLFSEGETPSVWVTVDPRSTADLRKMASQVKLATEQFRERTGRMRQEFTENRAVRATSSVNRLIDNTVSLPSRQAEDVHAASRAVRDGADFDEELDGGSLETLDAMLATSIQAKRLAKGANASPQNLAEFLNTVHQYQRMGRQVVGDLEGAQRSASKHIDPDELQGWEDLNQYLPDSANGVNGARALAVAVGNASDSVHGMRIAKDWMRWNGIGEPPRGRLERGFQAVLRARQSSMLSAPGTHIRNIVGNTIPVLYRLPEGLLARTFEGKPLKGVRETQARTGALLFGQKMALKMLRADAASTYKGGSSKAYQALKEEEWLNYQDLLADFRHRPKHEMDTDEVRQSLEDFGLADEATQGTTRRFLGKAYRNIEKGPFALLQASDMYFKYTTFFAELHVRATSRGWDLGLRGKELTDYVADQLTKVKRYDEDYEAAHALAHEFTFTNRLGKRGEKIEEIVNMLGGAGRVFIPFFRTPLNIGVWVGKRTPLANLLFKSVRTNLGPGATQEMRAQELSRMSIGAAMIYGGYELTDAGLVQMDQWGRVSVLLGDTWVDITYLPLAGSSIGVGYVIRQALHSADTKEKVEYATAIAVGAASVVGRVFGETSIQDIDELLGLTDAAMTEPERVPRIAERVLTGFAANLTPLNALRREIDRAIHGGTIAETRSGGGVADSEEGLLEAVHESLMGLIRRAFPEVFHFQERFPRREVFGDVRQSNAPYNMEVDGQSYSLYGGESFIFSATATLADDKTAAAMELKRLKYLWAPGPTPRSTSWPLAGGGVQTVEYTLEERDFLAEVAGKAFRREANTLIGTTRYQEEMDDEQKVDEWVSIRNQTLQEAQAAMLEKFPELRARYTAAKLRASGSQG